MFRFTTNYETLFATQYAVAGGANYAKISQLQKKGDPRIGIALCANTQAEGSASGRQTGEERRPVLRLILKVESFGVHQCLLHRSGSSPLKFVY